ncbi:MAG: hypothetical protein FWG71_10340, partial [Synergistaceae bacterium]|nr:hypothetical protein [Synergistaceae bacterium]
PLPNGYIIRVNNDGGINIISDPVYPPDPDKPDPQTPGGGGCNSMILVSTLLAFLVFWVTPGARGNRRKSPSIRQ